MQLRERPSQHRPNLIRRSQKRASTTLLWSLIRRKRNLVKMAAPKEEGSGEEETFTVAPEEDLSLLL
jgi:hypothetical protein